MDRLLAEVPSGVERADVLLELAYTSYSGDPAHRRALRPRPRRGTGDAARQSGIWAHRSAFHLWQADAVTHLADARRALDLADQVGDAGLIAVSIARVRFGEYTPGSRPRAFSSGASSSKSVTIASGFREPPLQQARVLMRLGQLDEARRA